MMRMRSIGGREGTGMRGAEARMALVSTSLLYWLYRMLRGETHLYLVAIGEFSDFVNGPGLMSRRCWYEKIK